GGILFKHVLQPQAAVRGCIEVIMLESELLQYGPARCGNGHVLETRFLLHVRRGARILSKQRSLHEMDCVGCCYDRIQTLGRDLEAACHFIESRWAILTDAL